MKKLFTTAMMMPMCMRCMCMFSRTQKSALCFINFHIGSQTANAGAEKRCEFPGSFYLSQKTY